PVAAGVRRPADPADVVEIRPPAGLRGAAPLAVVLLLLGAARLHRTVRNRPSAPATVGRSDPNPPWPRAPRCPPPLYQAESDQGEPPPPGQAQEAAMRPHPPSKAEVRRAARACAPFPIGTCHPDYLRDLDALLVEADDPTLAGKIQMKDFRFKML